jgi:transcription antitermination factor NusG
MSQPSAPPLNEVLPENLIAQGWAQAKNPDGRIYYYKRGDKTSSVWYLRDIPGYQDMVKPAVVQASVVKPVAAVKDTGVKFVSPKENPKNLVSQSKGHKKNAKSFVSKRITRFEEGMDVKVISNVNNEETSLIGKTGYITCVLGKSCMVQLKDGNGGWESYERLVHEKDLKSIVPSYIIGDNIEIMKGPYEGVFATIDSINSSKNHLHVIFWSDYIKIKAGSHKNGLVHRVSCQHVRSTNLKNPHALDASDVTIVVQGKKTEEKEIVTYGGETTGSIPKAFFPTMKRLVKGSKVQITNEYYSIKTPTHLYPQFLRGKTGKLVNHF